jgi:hypothetical protein
MKYNMSRSVWALEDDDISELLGETCEVDAKGWLLSLMKGLSRDDFVRVTVGSSHIEGGVEYGTSFASSRENRKP